MMEQLGTNSDLTFAAIFNLAEQYCNAKMWPEAINTYQSILKNRSFTNTGTANKLKTFFDLKLFSIPRPTSYEHWRDPLPTRSISESNQIFPNGH